MQKRTMPGSASNEDETPSTVTVTEPAQLTATSTVYYADDFASTITVYTTVEVKGTTTLPPGGSEPTSVKRSQAPEAVSDSEEVSSFNKVVGEH